LGVKVDAVPGRLNVVFLRFPVGMFFGFCSELCGVGHSFMPIFVSSLLDSFSDSLESEPEAEDELVSLLLDDPSKSDEVLLRFLVVDNFLSFFLSIMGFLELSCSSRFIEASPVILSSFFHF